MKLVNLVNLVKLVKVVNLVKVVKVVKVVKPLGASVASEAIARVWQGLFLDGRRPFVFFSRRGRRSLRDIKKQFRRTDPSAKNASG